ncbi:MAG: hypothetical protein COA79_05110 [Planctomycetota bacterium]|nr:MAG: hypothetical protein COA79_05110 [Planctomycetota bacterium]
MLSKTTENVLNKFIINYRDLYSNSDFTKDEIKDKVSVVESDLKKELLDQEIDLKSMEDLKPVVDKLEITKSLLDLIYKNKGDNTKVDHHLRFWSFVVFIIFLNCLGFYFLLKIFEGFELKSKAPVLATDLFEVFSNKNFSSTSNSNIWSNNDNLIIDFRKKLLIKSMDGLSIVISPNVKGRTKIVSDSRIVFIPEEELSADIQYHISLPEEFELQKRLPWDKKFSKTIQSEKLKLISISQNGKYYMDKSNCSIKFNYKIYPNILKKYLNIYAGSKRSLHYRVTNSNISDEFTLVIYNNNNFILNFQINKGLNCLKGNPVNTTIYKNLTLEPDLVLHSISSNWSKGNSRIHFKFNQRLSDAEIRENISLSPDVKYRIKRNWSAFRLEGDFKGGQRYKIAISKKLKARSGAIFSKDLIRTIIFEDAEPSIRFKNKGQYLSYSENASVKVICRNIKKLNVKIYSAYRNSINLVSQSLFSKDYSKKILHKDIAISSKLNHTSEMMLPLGEWLKGEDSKLVSIEISFDREDAIGDNYNYYYFDSREDKKFVSLSSIGISCRKGRDKVHVWLNDLNDMSSLEGYKVSCVSVKNQILGKGITDENGIAVFSIKEVDEGDVENTIIAENPFQTSFIRFNDNIKKRDVEKGLRPIIDKGYEAYFISERGYYRPGEVVHLEGIIRGEKLSVPEKFPLVIKIIKPNGTIFKSIKQSFDKQGAFSLNILMPKYEMTGQYEANITVPGFKEILGKVKWNLSDFVPRKIEVNLKSKQISYQCDEMIDLTIQGKHLYGDPAHELKTELEAHWYAKSKPYFSKYKKFHFGALANEKYSKVKSIGSGELNADGTYLYNFYSPKIWVNAPLELHLTGKVLEEGNRANPAYLKLDIHSYDYYFGINSVSDGSFPFGNEIPISIISLNQKGNLEMPDSEVEVLVEVENYNYNLKEVNGYYEYMWDKKRELESKTSIDLLNGRRTFKFLPKTTGRYIISIKSNHCAIAEYRCYVFGDGKESISQKSIDYLDMKLDKSYYNMGDIIKLKINAPFKGKLLLTGERENVLWSKIISINSFHQIIEIPLKTNSNFYLCGTLIRSVDSEDQTKPFCIRGFQHVNMTMLNKKINLKINLPNKIEPNKKLKLNLFTMNNNMAIPNVRVVLALVDKGAHLIDQYKIKNPLTYFYHKNQLEVREYDMYGSLLPPILKAISPSKPGGGGGDGFLRQRLNTVDADRVKILSIIGKPIYSDENGLCEFNFDIPDYNGKLNVVALACKDDLFGSQTNEIIVKNDFWADASFPLFFSSNDKCIVPFIIRNQLDYEAEFRLIIDTDLLVSLDTNINEFSCKVPSKGTHTLKLPFSISNEMGKSIIRWELISGETSIPGNVEMPIRPRGSRKSKNGYGILKCPMSSKISIPGNWVKGSATTSLTITGEPWIKAKSALKYCVQYPYGCVEQTTSKSFPLLYIKDLDGLFNKKDKSFINYKEYMRSALRRLQSMQTYSGGLSMWPGGRSTHLFGSTYAAHFLIEAKNKGYAVDKIFLEKLIVFLKNQLKESKKANFCAYISYVISKYNLSNKSSILASFEKFERLSYMQQGLFSMALINSGLPQDSKRALERPVIKYKDDYFWNDPVKNKAMKIIFKIERGESKDIFLDIQSLLDSMPSKYHWGNTQRNAFALLALGKAVKFNEIENDWFCDLNISSDRSIKVTSNQTKTIPCFPGNSISIDLKGTGSLYYYYMSSGIEISDTNVIDKSNLKVSRVLVDYKTKKEIDVLNLKSGSLYQVEISIKSDMKYSNLVVNDLIPAGFTFERVYSNQQSNSSRSGVDHQENRDDRMITFFNTNNHKRSISLKYLIRATNTGEFYYPGLSVEHMYKANVFYNGLSQKVLIK